MPAVKKIYKKTSLFLYQLVAFSLSIIILNSIVFDDIYASDCPKNLYARGVSSAPANAIKISNINDLAGVSKDLNASYYLTSDIVIPNKWVPIGGAVVDPSGMITGGTFNGKFYGGGHSITFNNIQFNNSDGAKGTTIGLFSGTGFKADIRDLIVCGDFSIINNGIGEYAFGLLAGANSGKVTNVAINNANLRINGKPLSDVTFGALTGRNMGPLSNILINGTVLQGYTTMGLLTGYNLGNILNVTAFGRVVGVGDDIGGLIGIDGGDIVNVNVRASVFGSYYIGGIAGELHNVENFRNNSFSGNVGGNYYTGGAVGWADYSKIDDTIVDASVNNTFNYAGGIAGMTAFGTTITNSASNGSVFGASGVGGIVGSISDGTVSGTFSNSKVTGGDFIGGLVGGTNNANIDNSYSTGQVYGMGGAIGGLVGILRYGKLTRSYTTSYVSGRITTGALVGYISPPADIVSAYVIEAEFKDAVSGQPYETVKPISVLTKAWPLDWDSSVWTLDKTKNRPLLNHFANKTGMFTAR